MVDIIYQGSRASFTTNDANVNGINVTLGASATGNGFSATLSGVSGTVFRGIHSGTGNGASFYATNGGGAIAASAISQCLICYGDQASAIDIGPYIEFNGRYQGDASVTQTGIIASRKENATVSNTAFYLSFATSPAGSGFATEKFRITSDYRYTFGGSTNAFPALKRSGTDLQFRLADDSGYTSLTTSQVQIANAGAGTAVNLTNNNNGNGADTLRTATPTSNRTTGIVVNPNGTPAMVQGGLTVASYLSLSAIPSEVSTFNLLATTTDYVFQSFRASGSGGTSRDFLWRLYNNDGGTATDLWRMTTSGHFLAGVDNSYNIGAVNASRPSNGYFGTSVSIGDTIGAGAGGNATMAASSYTANWYNNGAISTGTNIIRLFSKRGTINSPSNALTGDYVGDIIFGGQTNNNYALVLSGVVTGAVGSAAIPIALAIHQSSADGNTVPATNETWRFRPGPILSGQSGGVYAWTNSSSDASGTIDAGISRISSSTIGIGNGTSGSINGTLQLGAVVASGTITTVSGTNTSTNGAGGYFETSDSGTNTIPQTLIVAHTTSGTATAGFGAGLAYYIERASGVVVTGADVRASWVDATNANAVLDFRVCQAASSEVRASIYGDARFELVSSTGSAVSASGAIAFRSNAGVAEVSQNGGAWAAIATGTSNAFTRSGTDILYSNNGDTLYFNSATSLAAPGTSNLATASSSTSGVSGGHLSITLGQGGGGPTGTGGTFTLTGGAAGASGSQIGGHVNFIGGQGSNSAGLGGSIALTSGAGGSTSGNSGSITLTTGTVTLGSSGAIIAVTSNGAGAGNNPSGGMSFTTGTSTGNATTGGFEVITGNPASTGGSGPITLTTGNTSSGNSGNITLVTGTSSSGVQGGILFNARAQGQQGSDVASANDMTLTIGNYFDITGTTQINAIATSGWRAGSMVTLQFDSNPTVKNNTAGGAGFASILLAGAADFSATAGDTLTLIYDGTTWREVARAVI